MTTVRSIKAWLAVIVSIGIIIIIALISLSIILPLLAIILILVIIAYVYRRIHKAVNPKPASPQHHKKPTVLDAEFKVKK